MKIEEDKAFVRAMLGDDVVDEAERNAVLVHEGVRGMKWGIWNEETRKRRMRERNLRKARRARKKKAREEAKVKAKEEAKQKELDRMNANKAYEYAQKEFKKKVVDFYKNIDQYSLKQISEAKQQIEAGASLLDVKIKKEQKEKVSDKVDTTAKKLASIAASLGTLGENLPKMKKGVDVLLGKPVQSGKKKK